MVIGIIVVALIFINVGLILYFRRQKRPFKRLTDEEKEGLTRTSNTFNSNFTVK